ncbi:MAG: hypothetical protein AB7F40_04305 [Victivallaceae bacterium]
MSMVVTRTQEGSETWRDSSTCTSAEIKYHVYGMSSKAEAIAAIYEARPSAYGTLSYSNIRLDSVDGNGNAEFSVVYGGSSSSGYAYAETDEPVLNFDCSGGTRHVNYAIAQRRVFGDLDAGGAVGWNGKTGQDMEVTGVDVPTGQMRETYTKLVSTGKLTTNYKRRLYRLVGKVNSSKFKGWDSGEVMFLGASFSAPTNGNTKVVVSYNFSIQENERNSYFSGILVGLKRGWEYIWAVSSSVIAGSSPVAALRAVYVAQVAEYGDFSDLGL